VLLNVTDFEAIGNAISVVYNRDSYCLRGVYFVEVRTKPWKSWPDQF